MQEENLLLFPFLVLSNNLEMIPKLHQKSCYTSKHYSFRFWCTFQFLDFFQQARIRYKYFVIAVTIMSILNSQIYIKFCKYCSILRGAKMQGNFILFCFILVRLFQKRVILYVNPYIVILNNVQNCEYNYLGCICIKILPKDIVIANAK